MLVGVDQVLLDLVVEVDSDLGVFERFGLERNTQSLAEARHAPLLRDLARRAHADEGGTSAANAGTKAESTAPSAPVCSAPGGTVANALRGAAWWSRQQQRAPQPLAPKRRRPAEPPALKMLGRVGIDAAAERLRSELLAAGVEPLFDTAEPVQEPLQGPQCMSDHTGLCCCLIAGKERTMVTELGAGRRISSDGQLVQRVAAAVGGGAADASGALPRILVVSGFYVQADAEAVAALCSWMEGRREDGSPRPLLALTVGAQWCTGLPAVQAVARAADFVFANEPETIALAEAVAPREGPARNFDAALADVARWKERGWMIGTCGPRAVGAMPAGASGASVTVPVTPIEPAKFVDDVGAGDAFMGAFLAMAWELLASQAQGASALLTADDVKAACDAGIAAAAAVVQCSGAQFPQDPQ